MTGSRAGRRTGRGRHPHPLRPPLPHPRALDRGIGQGFNKHREKRKLTLVKGMAEDENHEC